MGGFLCGGQWGENKILGEYWLTDKKLCDRFPSLYACCRDKEVLVSDCWDRGDGT